MLNFLLNLQELIKKVKNVNFKIEKKDEYDYFYITSDAFEITVFCKDKALSDVIKFLIALYETKYKK
jgi:hypothetical protein